MWRGNRYESREELERAEGTESVIQKRDGSSSDVSVECEMRWYRHHFKSHPWGLIYHNRAKWILPFFYQRAIRPILIIVWWLWWCTRRNWAQIGRDKPERTQMMLFLRVSGCVQCSCGCLPSFRSCNRFSWPEKSSLVDMLTEMETDWPDFRGRWDRASCRSQLTNSPNSFSGIHKKGNICLQHFGQEQTGIILNNGKKKIKTSSLRNKK